jgi:hypothetical protein
MSVTIESLIEDFKSFNADVMNFGFIAMQAAKDSPVAIGSHAFYLSSFAMESIVHLTALAAEATEGTELLAKFAAGQLAWAERNFALKGLSIPDYEELDPEALAKMQEIADKYSRHLVEEDYAAGFDD